MKMKVILLLVTIVSTPLLGNRHAQKNRDPHWDIKELTTKRALRGKEPRGRSTQLLRKQCGLIRGVSTKAFLEYLEPKDAYVPND